MNKHVSLLYLPGVGLAAVFFGLLGFMFLVSDFGITETAWSRVIIIILYNIIAGWIIGFLAPRHSWMAGLAGWSGFAFGIAAFTVGLVHLNMRGISLSFLSSSTVLFTLLGGRIGQWMRTKK